MANKKGKGKAVEAELEDEVETDSSDEAQASSAKQEVTFGVKHLADHLSEKLGKTITTRDLRTQIRRMAREDNPRVDREVVAGNRSRYDWPKGLKDPEVKAIIKAVEAGELEAGKKAALDALKEKKAAQKAAGGKGKGKGKGKKGKAEPEPEDDDEVELDD